MDEKREFTLGERKDVVVRPPAARLAPSAPEPGKFPVEIPWKEMYQDTDRELRTTKKEMRELADFASGVTSLCLSLTKMLIDAKHSQATDDTVTVPKALHEATLGAGLRLGEDKDGNPTLTVKSRGRERIAPVE